MSFTEHLSLSPYVSGKLSGKAKIAFETTPWPTTRMENWKYTRVAKLQKLAFHSSKEAVDSISPYLIDPATPALVFVNGMYAEDLSSLDKSHPLYSAVTIYSNTNNTIEDSLLNVENELFNALNTAFLNDGMDIRIPRNKNLGSVQVIHILKGDTSLSNFKMRIFVDDFAELNIIQGFFSDNSSENCFANVTSEIKVGKNSKLSIDKIQYENESSFHINTEVVEQEADSTFTINTITLNGGLVRNNLNINVNGQNATTNLFGAYVLKGKQHVDNHTVVDHRVANCMSNELYKGVIDENATGVFNGKVFVRPDAQKINAFQSNGNVLLSDNATINSKPELEIYADDVKCSHGSTTGQLDENAVFYLEARGISRKKAVALLVSAFVNEAIEKIENQTIVAFIHEKVKERYNWEF